MTEPENTDGHCNDDFSTLQTQSHDFLEAIEGRQLCPVCQKSRKFYCYTCYVMMDKVKETLRTVQLPIKLDVIKHRNEGDGKSTAPHAKVISPASVTIYEYPCIPDYDTEKVILVFPCEESVTLDRLALGKTTQCANQSAEHCDNENYGGVHDDHIHVEHCEGKLNENLHVKILHKPERSQERNRSDSRKRKCETSGDVDEDTKSKDDQTENTEVTRTDVPSPEHGNSVPDRCLWKSIPKFEKVVFIDSTWLQAKKIFADERLKDLRRVELKSRLTKFWRPQHHPDTYLATIEAIYYFFKDFHQIFISNTYSGEYDNLLFFFLYTYKKVQASQGSKKTCKR